MGRRIKLSTVIAGTGLFGLIMLTTALISCENSLLDNILKNVDAGRIELSIDSTKLTKGDTVSNGNVVIGHNDDLLFTIENVGNSAIEDVSVTHTGGSTRYSVLSQPDTAIESGDTSTFTIRFNPDAYGDAEATFEVNHNNPFEDPLTFYINSQGHYQGVKSISSSGDVGKGSSLVANEQTVYVSYYYESSGDLRLARSLDGGFSWETDTIDSGGDVGLHTSIARNTNQFNDVTTIYIAYYDATNGNLKLATAEENSNSLSTWSWTISTIRDSTDDEGRGCCISENGQRISYINTTTNPDSYCYCELDGTGAYPMSGPLKVCEAWEGNMTGTTLSYSSESLVYNIFYNEYDSGVKFSYYHEKYSAEYYSRTVDSGGDSSLGWPSICSNGTHVYVSYFDSHWGPLNSDFYFSRSVDNGDTFSSPVIIETNLVTEYEVTPLAFSDITYEGGNIYLIFSGRTSGFGAPYYNQNLNFCFSSNNGVDWSSTDVIDSSDSGNTGLYCSIDASGTEGEYIFISYYNDITQDLMFAKSIDGGQSWN